MNLTEEKIWDYIDGNCNAADCLLIAQLIADDPFYKKKFEELNSFHQSLSSLETDEPSMAFTNNVMSKIQLQSQLVSLKTIVDKRIIIGIAAFFIASLFAVVIAIFYNINWSAYSEASSTLNFDYQLFKPSAAAKTTITSGFILFNILAVLILIDHFLRKKKSSF